MEKKNQISNYFRFDDQGNSSASLDFENNPKAFCLAALQQLDTWVPGSERGADAGDRAPFQVVDLFCGCGGMSVGFDAVSNLTGAFEVVGGCDISEASAKTFTANLGAPGLVRDVRMLAESEEMLQQFLKELPNYEENRATVLIGCAPCQGFTTHRKKNWHQTDERNSLIEDFACIAVQLNPECVVMENVPEMLSKKYWDHFQAAKKTLENAGYIVKQTIYNTADFGVPQDRFRALVIAMKQDFALPASVFGSGEHKTVRDAISDLPAVKPGVPHPSDHLHRSASHKQTTIETIRSVPKDGGSRPVGVGPKCLDKVNGFSDVYGRLRWDKPAITITHYARNPASGRFVHPEQDRGLTLREAARLQSFPDNYQFSGSNDDMFRQVGEAVPPAFSIGVASAVLYELLGIAPRDSDKEDRPPIVIEPVSSSYSSVIVGLKAKRDRTCDIQP